MRIAVLGGGKQARGVLYDLVAADAVDDVLWVDMATAPLHEWLDALRRRGHGVPGKVEVATVDARDTGALDALLRRAGDVVIDMLPRQFGTAVVQAAIQSGVHVVHTNFEGELPRLRGAIEAAGIAVLPEMGFDPGIDLVMCAEAVRLFDRVDALSWYGGGFPEPALSTSNPLGYKITWIWEGVLHSYNRPAVLLRDGSAVHISAAEVMADENTHRVHVPELGDFDAFANLDATDCAEKLGIDGQVRDLGRYVLRWRGHCRLWNALKQLGFLEMTQVPGLPEGVTPRAFMEKHLEPRLQYAPGERDVAINRIDITGMVEGARKRCILQVIDYRDLDTGLMAMNRMVGFPAAIAARMIADGTLGARGLLTPIKHVPYEPFMSALRGHGIRETRQWCDPVLPPTRRG